MLSDFMVRVVGIAIGMSVSHSAFAYDCLTFAGCGCRWEESNAVFFQFRQYTGPLANQNFTAAERLAVIDGADSWEAGNGDIIRGAQFRFVRTADVAVYGHADNRSTVAMVSRGAIQSSGGDQNSLAVMDPHVPWPSCSYRSGDILFANDIVWSVDGEDEILGDDSVTIGSGPYSISAVARHEFGHRIGFAHEEDEPSVMAAVYPGAGTPHGHVRVGEDEAQGLMAQYSGGSTGANLMLRAFSEAGESDGDQLYRRSWRDSTYRDRLDPAGDGVCPGDTFAPAFEYDPFTGQFNIQFIPFPVFMEHTGPQSTASVRVNHYWIQAFSPLGGDPTDLGQYEPYGVCGGSSFNFKWRGATWSSLTTNSSTTVAPGQWKIPSSMPAGFYIPCAKVDPLNTVVETSESDNVVLGVGAIKVLSSSDPICN